MIALVMLLFLHCFKANAQPGSAMIGGTLNFLTDGDSVKLEVYKYPAFSSIDRLNSFYTSVVKDHSFSFTIRTADKPAFIYINFGRLDKNISTLLVQKGDSIHISEKNGSYEFTGRNAITYSTVYALERFFIKYADHPDFKDENSILSNFYATDSLSADMSGYLLTQKAKIPGPEYNLLFDNVISRDLFRGTFPANAMMLDTTQHFDAVKQNLKRNASLARELDSIKSDTNVIYTQYFLYGMVNSYLVDSCFLEGKKFDASKCYYFFKENFKGKVRDALVTYLLYLKRRSNANLIENVSDALSIVTTSDFKEILTNLKSHLGKGSPAYNFTLTDEYGQKRHFDEFKNKVVLLDFWYTGCPSCAQTAPYLKSVEEKFIGAPVVFVTICIDKKSTGWHDSLKKGTYSSDLSVNLFTDGLGSKHPVINYYEVTSFPGLLLIDKNGKLCSTFTDPRLDNGASLTTAIKAQL
jgi:thiol-disulfide isomerase/thioredoxin